MVGRGSGFSNDDFALNYKVEFDVRPHDELGNPRIDVEGDLTNEIAIFPGAITDFQAGIQDGPDNVFLFDDFDFNDSPDEIVLILDPHSTFASELRDEGFNEFDEGIDVSDPEIPNSITLDLITRAGVDDVTGAQTVEYTLTGGGLVGLGINEFTSIVSDSDSDDTNGFQVIYDREAGFNRQDEDNRPGFQLEFGGPTIVENLADPTRRELRILKRNGLELYQIDTQKAINDINYIVGHNPFEENIFGLADFVTISGPSNDDPSRIEIFDFSANFEF